MFVSVVIEDTVLIAPKNFGNELPTVKQEIRTKYCGKYIKDVGLCITLLDIESVGDGYVSTGEGAAQVAVKFRMIVFRPFRGEVIDGKITKSDEEGLKVSLGFFDDIHVPIHLLPHPSVFDENEQLWYWQYDEHNLWFELKKPVRFKVAEVRFNGRVSRRPQPITSSGGALSTTAPVVLPDDPAPMVIEASMTEAGLGCLHWWAEDGVEATQDDETTVLVDNISLEDQQNQTDQASDSKKTES